jgi:phospholipase C
LRPRPQPREAVGVLRFYLVTTINVIMQSRFWKSTAILIMYDDSDGWYDHQMSPIVNLFGGRERRCGQ